MDDIFFSLVYHHHLLLEMGSMFGFVLLKNFFSITWALLIIFLNWDFFVKEESLIIVRFLNDHQDGILGMNFEGFEQSTREDVVNSPLNSN